MLRNHVSSNVFYAKFNIKGLKFITKFIIYSKRGERNEVEEF
jgi:hypothetical protein